MNQQLSLLTVDPLVTIEGNRVITTSLKVAELFVKSHYHVLRDIKNLDCSEEFGASSFGCTEYLDEQGKPHPQQPTE